MKRTVTMALVLGAWAAGSALAGEVVGWRTDGTGSYPDAEPPTTWSPTENVVWKTPMPSWSNSTPVIVGDKLFVCSEPTTLLCASTKDGRILWQKDNSYLDTLPADERPRMQALMEQVDITGTTRQLRDAESKLRRAEGLLKRLAGDANLAQQKEQLSQPIRQEMQQHSQRLAELKAKLQPVERFILPETQEVNGFSSPTPVSDGRHVWVLFCTGTAACYDLDGNRKWIRFIEKPTDAYGHSASPVLADGKLIVHVQSLVALRADTGEEVWKIPSPVAWGTSVVARIAGQDVIITPKGQFVQAANGRRLADRTAQLAFNAPLLGGGVVYFIEHKSLAFRLPQDPDGKPERLWSCELANDRYYASPALHQGVLYDVTQAGVLSAIDANQGRRLYEQKLDFGRPRVEQLYPSVTVAGKYFYVSTSSGITVVAETGPQFRQVARNSLEQFRSCPVFVGKRMYIRGLKHLWCIGE